MKSAIEHWGDQEVEILKVPERESAQRQQLTLERLEAISTFISTPEWGRDGKNCPKDVAELATSLRSTHGNLKRWAHDPRMTRRVIDKLWQAAVYALPNILYGQIIAASPVVEHQPDGTIIVTPGDTKAANYVATVAKVIRSGMQIQQNQTTNNFEPTPEYSDEELRSLDQAMSDSTASISGSRRGDTK